MSCSIDFSWLQQHLPGYQPLFSDPHTPKLFQEINVMPENQMLSASAFGLKPEQPYFSGPSEGADDLRRLWGTCRFVANDWDELQQIDQVARLHKREGALEPVGLRVISARYDDGNQHGIPERTLQDLAQKIKTLPAISIRGCFAQGSIGNLHGDALGRYFRECYELAKRVTVILPCGMPYLCIVGGAEAACQNAAEHPETLEAFLRQAEIVAAQNRTAFYAKLLIA